MRPEFFPIAPSALDSYESARTLHSFFEAAPRIGFANSSPHEEVKLSYFTLNTVLILGTRSIGALWRGWIEAEPDLYVVGDSNMNLASASCRTIRPDVILFHVPGAMALSNPVLNYLHYVFPDAQLLLAVSGEQPFCRLPPSAHQVRGMVRSDASPEMLARGLRIVSAGGTFFPRSMRS